MIDPTKTYKTRSGREVRIYAVDCGGDFNVHGAVKSVLGDKWIAETWRSDGSGSANWLDLIEVKPRIVREYWVNHYSDKTMSAIHSSRDEADTYARLKGRIRVACIHHVDEFEEGEGL